MYHAVIGVYGTPRTGTSWLGQIFDSSPQVRFQTAPFYSWSFRDKINIRSSSEEMNDYFKNIYASEDHYLLQSERREKGVYPTWTIKDKSPEFLTYKEVSTIYMLPFLLEKVDNYKAAAIVRNPYDALTSWLNNPREFNPDWDFEQEWYFANKRNKMQPDMYFGFHKWKEALAIFYEMEQQFPQKFCTVSYEKLYNDTMLQIENLFSFFELDIHEQTKEFIYKSTHSLSNDPYSVFRNHKAVKPSSDKKLPEGVRKIIRNELQWFKAAVYYGYK